MRVFIVKRDGLRERTKASAENAFDGELLPEMSRLRLKTAACTFRNARATSQRLVPVAQSTNSC